jgi:antitoxin HigA-1
VIRSFRHKGLERSFTSGDHKKIDAKQRDRIHRILDRLDAAAKPEDLNLPGFDFHALKGLPLMRSMRDPKRKPTHPGELLRLDILPALGMTQTELARRLGVSRLSVSELILAKRALSADMAIRIGRLTDTTPESWLRMQEAVDLWELERDPKRYKHIEPVAA